MLRYIYLLAISFSVHINSDIFVSSPKIKLNADQQRLIELKIENTKISDSDVTLFKYKTNELIDTNDITYTLIQDYEDYYTFTIALSESYLQDYFSFKINIKDEYIKDIFIFLPSKIRNIYQIESPNTYKQKPLISNQQELVQTNSATLIEIEEPFIDIQEEEQTIIKGSEITTIWSMAKEIKGKNDDISIYQIMWSLYLGNKDAFINENINLVRKDIDILVPKMTDIKDVSYQIAKDSISAMNESFSNSFSDAAKSLLVLTAPQTPEIKEDIDISKIDQEEPTFISFDQPENPEAFIEQNTKQITLGIENEVLDKLIDEKDDSTTNEDVTFEIFDLLFIGLISLASGILLAFIFIYLRSMKNSKSIQYDFEEAYDDEFNSSSMPSGLSIENNANQQQLDLAITYFEMNDLDNAKKLLKDLLNSDDAEIQKASKKLLDKFN